MKTVYRTNIELPAELATRLEETSKAAGVPKAAIIREALAVYLRGVQAWGPLGTATVEALKNR